MKGLLNYHLSYQLILQINQFHIQKVFHLLIRSQYLFQCHEMMGVQQKRFYPLYQQVKHVVPLLHQNLYQQYKFHFEHDSVQLMSIFFQQHDFLIFKHLDQQKDQLISRFYPNLFLFFQSSLDCEPLVSNKVDTKSPRNQVIKLSRPHVRSMFYLLQADH